MTTNIGDDAKQKRKRRKITTWNTFYTHKNFIIHSPPDGGEILTVCNLGALLKLIRRRHLGCSSTWLGFAVCCNRCAWLQIPPKITLIMPCKVFVDGRLWLTEGSKGHIGTECWRKGVVHKNSNFLPKVSHTFWFSQPSLLSGWCVAWEWNTPIRFLILDLINIWLGCLWSMFMFWN